MHAVETDDTVANGLRKGTLAILGLWGAQTRKRSGDVISNSIQAAIFLVKFKVQVQGELQYQV